MSRPTGSTTDTEYTGVETFVASKVENEDVTWIPERRALALEADDEASPEELLASSSAEVNRYVSGAIGELQRTVTDLASKLKSLDGKMASYESMNERDAAAGRFTSMGGALRGESTLSRAGNRITEI